MKNLKYIILFTSLIILMSCNKKETAKAAVEVIETHQDIELSKAQFESSKMALGSMDEKDFPEVIKATGMIDVPPQSKEIVTSFYGGYVKKSSLLVGDKVRKGQVLVSIENPEFVDMQQNYLEIKDQLAYLQNEYERQKTLFEEKITSQKKYLKAKSEYNRQLTALNGLAKKLKMLNINPNQLNASNIASSITLYSSINGSVTKVNVSKGTHISPSDEILEIVNTDHIHVELTVFEKDAMKIKENQVIRFKISEASDKYYDAEVHLVGKTIDEKSRTIKVHGHLKNETKNTFNIGMFVDAFIEISNKKSFALPEDAIVEQEDEKVVFILEKEENNHLIFETEEVKVGRTYNGFTEILSDNLKDKKIVIKGAYDLSGGEGGGHSH